MYYDSFDSPIGTIYLLADEKGLRRLTLCIYHPFEYSEQWLHAPEQFVECKKQINEYFRGERKQFDLPLAPRGTDFQKQVWQALSEIPFGETRSYGQIARAIDKEKAYRAVGMANDVNPIPIIIPCHRVIGSKGELTGYRYGLEIKQKLLDLEQAK